MKKLFVMLCAIALVSGYACKEKEELMLNVDAPATYNVPQTGGSETFHVTTNAMWTVSSSQPWCKLNDKQQTMSGTGDVTVTIAVAENTDYSPRTATISVSAQGVNQQFTITLVQQGIAPAFAVTDPAGFTLEGGLDSLMVTANVSWTLTVDEEAYQWSEVFINDDSTKVFIQASPNNNPSSRAATLTFTPAQGLPVVTKEVRQFGEDPELIISPSSVTAVQGSGKDVVVTVSSNMTYTVTPNDAWITEVVPQTTSVSKKTVVNNDVTLRIAKNETNGVRTGSVTFTAGTMTATFTVSQNSVKSEAAADSVALVRLYKASTSAATWTVGDRWDTTGTVSYKNWKGVVTNADGRVTKLTLGLIGSSTGGSNKVVINNDTDFAPFTELKTLIVATGAGSEIPSSLGSLQKLEYVRIKSCTNAADGKTIPAAFFNATNIHFLELSSFSYGTSNVNFIAGAIPADIAKLTKLDTLILSSNAITAIPSEISALTSLLVLEIRNNYVTAGFPFPDAVCSLTSLKKLDMYQASLNGTISTNIGNLTNLEYLDLSTNKFTQSLATIPASICNLTKLKILNLNSAQLTGAIPANIGNLTDLVTLNLSSNRVMSGTTTVSPGLSGTIPSSIGSLVNLTSLSLKQNAFSGTLPGTIGGLTKLTGQFDVSENALTDIGSGVGQLKTVFLVFSKNKLSTMTENSFPNATNLNLSDNLITNAGFLATLNAPKLTALVLTNNQIASINVAGISAPLLNSLTLTNNKLTTIDLSGLTTLQNLYLSSNLLTSITLPVASAASLTNLDLSANSFTALNNLPALPKMITLTLKGNPLTSFAVPNMTGSIDFSATSATPGTLATITIPTVTNVAGLNLPFNQLTTIDLSNAPKLVTVNLSDNKLTSVTIPDTSATNIQTLNLSGNKFTSLTNLPAMPKVTTLGLNNNLQMTTLTLPAMAELTNINIAGPGTATANRGSLTAITFPATAGALPKLYWMNLSNNNLTDFPANIEKVGNASTNDITINLGYNQITTFPASLNTMVKLNNLDLTNNNIEDLTTVTFYASKQTTAGLYIPTFKMIGNRLTEAKVPASLKTQTYYKLANFCPQQDTYSINLCQ